MKKFILGLNVLIVILLGGCTLLENSDSIECEEGTTLVNETCEPIEEPKDNKDPKDNENPVSSSTECPHLNNIDDYIAVWCDEFDYEGLPDNEKWNYDVGGHGWGNNELQYYTEKDLDNASVKDGMLTITAIKENIGSNTYSSARLVTRDKGDWLYGKIQVRAKLPSGRGTWPAIWMLPTEWAYGGWPHSGEIDIMEHVGYEDDKVHATIHTGAFNHMLGTQIGFSLTDDTLETDFHVYEIEWEPGIIKAYMDDIHYASFAYNPDASEGTMTTEAWPFDKEFHLILNIAVGGSWGGVEGVDPNVWPQEMVIDYVRVYQKDYITGDLEIPDKVKNIEAVQVTSSTGFLKWDKATDDKAVEKYEVYINGDLVATPTHNALNMTGLQAATMNNVEIYAIDFAGNKSDVQTYSFSTVSPPTINGIIEAEDFAVSQGIDTENTTDVDGGRNVGWTDNGDYLEYVLEVTESGNYTIDFRLASGAGGGTFVFDDGTSTLNISTPATGGWQTWQTVTSSSIYLSKGVHTFRITFSSGGTNINYFEFKKVE